jgi:quercetin dioxygenase-like cupin family protein
MTTLLSDTLQALVACAASRQPLGGDLPAASWTKPALAPGEAVYRNQNERLNIDFQVERLAFPHAQTLDPRIVRIAPGKNNEFHKHAHESLFVILAGEGEVRVGDHWQPVRAGDVAFVPRWIFHQTRNTSAHDTLAVLAITDFGFTSAVLGGYDQRTRLSQGGADVHTGADVQAGPDAQGN